MKFPVVTVMTLAALALTFSPAHAGAVGQVNFFLGQKSLDSSVPDAVQDQLEFGAVMSFGQSDWPVYIAADVLTSVDEETVAAFGGNVTLTAVTFEFDSGVRKIWKAGKGGKVLPYVGGGIGIIGAALELDNGFVSVDADDAALGLWADTGVFFRLGSHFNIGVDLRYSTADVDLDFGSGIVLQDVNAGGFSYGMLLGFGW